VVQADVIRSHPAQDRMASWRVLARPGFPVYFAGSTISNLGTWLQNTAQMLLAYKLTHSAFDVGAITATQFSGFLVLGPWAGHLAHRMDGKRVLLWTQAVSAVTAGVMAYLQLNGHLTKAELFAGALVIGLALTFALPVQTVMVAALVPEEDKKAALAMNSVSYNIGRTLSPVLYLAILASLGAGWAFALNAMSFLAFALTVVTIYPSWMTPQIKPSPSESSVRIVLRRPRIMLLLAMIAAVTLADDPVQVLGPSLSHQVLHVSSMWPAYFLSALGLGTILGALVPTPRRPAARQAAVPLVILAICVVIFAWGLNPWLSLAAAVLAGLAALLTGASAQTLLLTTIDDTSATQVMALWAVAWAGSKPIASFLDGWLATNLGLRPAAVLLAAPAVLIAGAELGMPKSGRARLKNAMRRHNQPYNEAQAASA
jgi:MFS family permease